MSSWKPNWNLCRFLLQYQNWPAGGIYTAWSCITRSMVFGIVPPDFISLNPRLNYVFTFFSFYILYISIVTGSIDSEYLFLSHFCKAVKCSFCVFIFVASYYLYTLVQCGIIIVPVNCDCSVSLCGTDVWKSRCVYVLQSELRWLLRLCSDFSKEMPWQIKTYIWVSLCWSVCCKWGWNK